MILQLGPEIGLRGHDKAKAVSIDVTKFCDATNNFQTLLYTPASSVLISCQLICHDQMAPKPLSMLTAGLLASHAFAEYTPNFEGEIEFQANATDISNACAELVRFALA